jgi:hypothetical protein
MGLFSGLESFLKQVLRCAQDDTRLFFILKSAGNYCHSEERSDEESGLGPEGLKKP